MTRRQAIIEAQASANAIIEQMERLAKGWDQGCYRDDDTLRIFTVQQGMQLESAHAFRLSGQFA